jgi:hypothetical protein
MGIFCGPNAKHMLHQIYGLFVSGKSKINLCRIRIPAVDFPHCGPFFGPQSIPMPLKSFYALAELFFICFGGLNLFCWQKRQYLYFIILYNCIINYNLNLTCVFYDKKLQLLKCMIMVKGVAAMWQIGTFFRSDLWKKK